MAFMLIPLSIAALDWISLARGWVKTDYLAKPGVIAALIVWLWVNSPPEPDVLVLWVTAGLVFSLAGDVLLMLPKEQFIGGLSAFLLSHLSYIVAFTPSPPPWGIQTIGLALFIGVLWFFLTKPIRAGLVTKNRSRLVPPVMIYTLVISLMLFTAWATLLRPGWPQAAGYLTAGGATLFFLSDLLLAWNRFVRQFRSARLYVRILYHSGQAAITAGAALASPFI